MKNIKEINITLLKITPLLMGLMLVFSACKRNPTDRLVNPTSDGSLPQTGSNFPIYTDELKTGGGVGFIPAGQNQSIDLVDQTSPRRGLAQVRYSWNGQPVNNQHLFAGFSLPITAELADIDTAQARDLSGPGYTTLRFQLRGSLSFGTVLRIEGPDDGTGGITAAQVELDHTQVTSGWTEISLTVPSAHFNAVKTFVTFSFQYTQPPRTTNPGTGGVIFVDDIRYEI